MAERKVTYDIIPDCRPAILQATAWKVTALPATTPVRVVISSLRRRRRMKKKKRHLPRLRALCRVIAIT